MTIDVKEINEVTVMALKGKMALGDGEDQFREAIRQELAKGTLKILVNFSEVTRLDSSGIGELVSAFTIISNRGGKLKLCNLPNRIIEILQITALITVFEIYHDEDEAIKSFE